MKLVHLVVELDSIHKWLTRNDFLGKRWGEIRLPIPALEGRWMGFGSEISIHVHVWALSQRLSWWIGHGWDMCQQLCSVFNSRTRPVSCTEIGELVRWDDTFSWQVLQEAPSEAWCCRSSPVLPKIQWRLEPITSTSTEARTTLSLKTSGKIQ